ncbi:MAG TPA: glycosyltransferase family 39 protein [Candidatus Sulfotelmatobacter sp.]|nr:glycosyltransferase family 39 protein [Candidatus Sulfotelmatobacter sp.]
MDALETNAGVNQQNIVACAKERSRNPRMRWLLLLGSLALVCTVAARDIRIGEFDYNVDEAQHAVTGLFVADAFRDLPLRHPVQYAYRYYAQYPAIAILHWPPLFYIFEGLSFLVLGPSVISARLTVLLFCVLLLYQWFRLVEETLDSYTAGICSAVLGLLPMILLFEKSVMLEIPSLALAVAAIRHWIAYLEHNQRKFLVQSALWLSAALLCKQTCIYVLAFCGSTLLVTGQWRRIFSREAAIFAAIVGVLAGPFLTLMLFLQGKAVANDLGSYRMSGWERVVYYGQILPNTLPPLLLVLALLGAALAFHWDTPRRTAIMGCWLLSGYATFSWLGQREPRFAVYWLPPLVYFAVGLITRFSRERRVRMAMRLAAVGLIAILLVPAWRYRRPYISGYKEIASRIVTNYHSGIILFDGPVPGNFVFFVRALDPGRRFVILRKVLYADDIRPGASSKELLHSKEEILSALREYGVRLAVVSQNLGIRFDSQRVLRAELSSDDFTLLQRFPIASNEARWQGESLLLYEKKNWSPPRNGVLRIRMLTLPHDIEIPLAELNH